MENRPVGFTRLSVPVDQVFTLEGQIAETISGRAYRAFDRATRKAAVVWITRGSLSSSEEKGITYFRNRLEELAELPEVVAPLYFGVDVLNVGYVVLPAFDGRPIHSPTVDEVEVGRRISGCLSVIETIHETGQGCGDLCLDSFIIRRDGSIALFAPLGELTIQATGSKPDGKGLAEFLPPEGVVGGEDLFFRDAYAVRKIAAYLSGPLVLRLPPRTSSQEGGGGLQEVLKLAERDLKSGELSVANIRVAFDRHRAECAALHVESGRRKARKQGQALADPDSAWDGSSLVTRGVSEQAHVEVEKAEAGEAPFAVRSQATCKAALNPRYFFVLGLPIAIAGALATSLFFRDQELAPAPKKGTPSTYDARHYELPERLRLLDNLGEVAAYVSAMDELDSAQNEGERKLVISFLARAARANGLFRGGDVLIEQLAVAQGPQAALRLTKSIAAALTPGLSASQRFEEAGRAYDMAPSSATALAVSLAFDLGDIDLSRDFVVRAVKDRLPAIEVGKYSTVGLMMLSPTLLDRFYEDIPDPAKRLPIATLRSILGDIDQAGGEGVSLVAQLLSLAGSGVGGADLVVHELESGDAMPPSARRALIHGLLGGCELVDVKALQAWYSAEAFKPLGAILIGQNDPHVSNAIMEALADPASGNPYGQRVAAFCLNYYKELEPRLFAFVGALAIPSPWREQALPQVLPDLSSLPKANAFMKTLMKGAPADVAKSLLARYASILDPMVIYDLLSSSDKEVRLLAIAALKDVNDILFLKLIVQKYQEEVDGDVRAAYERDISAIRERVVGATNVPL